MTLGAIIERNSESAANSGFALQEPAKVSGGKLGMESGAATGVGVEFACEVVNSDRVEEAMMLGAALEECVCLVE